MSESKTCVRCERAIDGYARICPYCNWDQNAATPPPQPEVAAVPAYVPPQERRWRKPVLTVIGGAALLITAFIVGFFVHGNEPPKNAPVPVTEKADPVHRAPRADVTLVPVNEALEQPITSAPPLNPAEGVPTEYQRSDATAVSSAEYTQLAARAKAEKKSKIVDPRSLTGPAYSQAPRREAAADELPVERARILVTTRPIPQYQPLPPIRVDQPITARLQLTVGPDGHVKDINVLNGVPGQTAKIIETVQTWRFKPATENGNPVSAPFSVDLSFQPDE